MPLPCLRPKDSFITCRDRHDGGGAQAAARISAMIFARLKGLTYAHSPLTDVEHAPPGMRQDVWAAEWERFFNLGHGEVRAADIEARGHPVQPLRKPQRLFFPRSRRLYVSAHCHRVTDRRPAAWAAIAPELRAKYQLTPKPRLAGYDDGKVQIAVHLRRGDVAATGKHAQWFTRDDAVLARLRRVLGVVGPEHASVRLFSQGRAEDFRAFEDLGARLHLDDDVFETIHHFVRSDLLFVAKSTFSYLGGVIGGQTCICEPFWHPNLPGWLSPDEMTDATLSRALATGRPPL